MKKITLELPIYTYQIDFGGHVSNIVYLQWMEIGRLKLLEAVGMPVYRIAEQGFIAVLVHTEITYRHPLHIADTVRIELWLSELKNVSASMEFRFYNAEGILAATGNQKGLFVDQKKMRPRRLEPEEQKLFQPYLQNESI
jgi:acyl-CoA thioester hydrolase